MTKTWVIFLSLTLLVTVAWVSSAIYYAKPNKPVSAEVQAALEPLNPEFDIPTLKEIESKVR
ncbi:MAG: hypothetical protein US86_C0001G0422 [Candidatus Daviesbacteria bacterium GW2011_GWA2_38_24]|uniref:Uncharacterized protein n=1 Tax=Candidatus Daviesbacteria bacterium GW2011_GWA2_38_24 TaxID=1618422 RepID=A0A0G0JWH8_9BACT|nr:MAG: hypothetical protein US86_C0001G0422 [Candidatus Daviesbacteria bacterium GW2011_GWA2_38_24]KKQ79208.1 MAG: hypothetical protein UT01_C0047G0009 [Candidatus Daviesbacteria bacterium GW2011_GWA1_38_7]OGE22816.1 MAG: hypothetical protein A2688_02925 [Candidatus Daviesbacteria bacterium RIFCSPHIGHO2_01_FULL_38_8]